MQKPRHSVPSSEEAHRLIPMAERSVMASGEREIANTSRHKAYLHHQPQVGRRITKGARLGASSATLIARGWSHVLSPLYLSLQRCNFLTRYITLSPTFFVRLTGVRPFDTCKACVCTVGGPSAANDAPFANVFCPSFVVPLSVERRISHILSSSHSLSSTAFYRYPNMRARSNVSSPLGSELPTLHARRHAPLG